MSGPVLALDSSTRAAHAAVGRGGRVLAAECEGAGANASSSLLPMVDRAMGAAGLSPRALAAVVVAGGPGSFTGLRIAAATAKGMVAALGVPLFAYSGLLALAAAHREVGVPVCALFDARNRDVYAGCWRFGADPEALLPVDAMSIDDLAGRLSGGDVRFVGDGALLHRPLLEEAFGAGSVLEDERSPAEGLLWLAGAFPEGGRVADAAAWQPDYVRSSGAERISAARGSA